MVAVTGTTLTGGRKQGGAPYENGSTVSTDITFVEEAAAANVCEVAITVVDGDGVAIAQPHLLNVWLSDAATGAGLTGTTASGTVTAKSASGAVFDTFVSKKALLVQTLATGVFTLEITDTGNTAFYICAQNPNTGEIHVTSAGVTAYGE